MIEVISNSLFVLDVEKDISIGPSLVRLRVHSQRKNHQLAVSLLVCDLVPWSAALLQEEKA